MSDHRVFLPARPIRGRPNRGSLLRRGLIAATAGALVLLGAACGGSASTDTPEAATGSAETAANIETTAPEPPVLVAAAISEAAAEPGGAELPSWVTARLEAEPPALALTYPAEGSTVTESYMVFSGKAEPGSLVAAGPYETKADEHGQWNIGLVLSAGQNVATFSTTSKEGVETKESVTVHLKPKEGTHQKPVDGSFHASQRYGSCGEKVPYDVFKGKAAPGSTISVNSAYGSGSTVAGNDGYWKIKVTFSTAPVGESFAVNVSDGSATETFSFVRTG